MKDFDIEPIQNALFDIYVSIAKVCEQLNLRHYLVAGSALGALRHGGFIPWDDDIDMALPRKDFVRFKTEGMRLMPSHLKWVDIHNTPEYPYLFAKVVDSRREVHARVAKQSGAPVAQGLFVDIWAIDGIPQDPFHRISRWFWKQRIRRAMSYRLTDDPLSPGQRLVWPLSWLAALSMPHCKTLHDFLAAIEKRDQSVDMRDSALSGFATEHWYEFYRPTPTRFFDPPRWLTFCGHQVPVLANVEWHLNQVFGPDYMTPPPPEERHPYHAASFEAPWKFGPTTPV